MLYCLLYICSQTNNTHTDRRTPSAHTHSEVRHGPFNLTPDVLFCSLTLKQSWNFEYVIFVVLFILEGNTVTTLSVSIWLSWLLKYCVLLVLFAEASPVDLDELYVVYEFLLFDAISPQDNPPSSPTQMRRSTSFRLPSPKRKSRRSSL